MIIASTFIIVVLVAVIGLLSLGSSHSSNIGVPTQSQAAGDGGDSPFNMTLNTIPLTSTLEGSRLILPNTTILGSNFNVIGAIILQTPQTQNFTETNGSMTTYVQWGSTIYVWNQTFVNGSTTNLDVFDSGGIAIIESGSASGLSSLSVAEQDLGTPPICNVQTTPTTCHTTTYSGPDYITTVNGQSVVVSPEDGELYWYDSNRAMTVNIVAPDVPMSTLLQIAGNMTSSPSSNQ